jgi:hypothetical protein
MQSYRFLRTYPYLLRGAAASKQLGWVSGQHNHPNQDSLHQSQSILACNLLIRKTSWIIQTLILKPKLVTLL